MQACYLLQKVLLFMYKSATFNGNVQLSCMNTLLFTQRQCFLCMKLLLFPIYPKSAHAVTRTTLKTCPPPPGPNARRDEISHSGGPLTPMSVLTSLWRSQIVLWGWRCSGCSPHRVISCLGMMGLGSGTFLEPFAFWRVRQLIKPPTLSEGRRASGVQASGR